MIHHSSRFALVCNGVHCIFLLSWHKRMQHLLDRGPLGIQPLSLGQPSMIGQNDTF